MAPSQLAPYALYTAAAISALSMVGHTQMGFELVFPSLRTASFSPSSLFSIFSSSSSPSAPSKKGDNGWKLDPKDPLTGKPLDGKGARLSTEEMGRGSALIGWMETNMVFGIMAILYTKWAKYGVSDQYEKSVLWFTVLYQMVCGVGYLRMGMYKPLLALWLGPGIAALSQVL